VSGRVAVLASGEGTNLQALIDHPVVGPHVALVVSDRPGARALVRARAAAVEAVVLERAGLDRGAWDARLDLLLRAHRVDLVVLAGFRWLLGPAFVASWRGRLVNVHPSLLPAFPGRHALRDALAAGARETGVTVHLVDEGVDTGPVLAQRRVAVEPGDDEQRLRGRLQPVEHRLYPEVVAGLLAGVGAVGGATPHGEPDDGIEASDLRGGPHVGAGRRAPSGRGRVP
jgi:phosphoribosylglycinamide formyltransferase-1